METNKTIFNLFLRFDKDFKMISKYDRKFQETLENEEIFQTSQNNYFLNFRMDLYGAQWQRYQGNFKLKKK